MSSVFFFRVACVRFCAAYAPFLRQERRADRPLYSRLWKKDGQSPFIGMPQGQRIPAPPDLAASIAQQLQKRVEAVGLLQKRRVDEAAEQLPVGGLRLVSQPLAVVIFPALRIGDYGEPMLGADGIAEPCDGPAGAEKIAELMLAVQRGGVPDDVIMNVLLSVCVATKKACRPFRNRSANS